MKLIDADAFMEIVNREYPCENRIDIKNLIDMTPTAYDVDKVVEELEKYLIQMVGRESILYAMIIQIVKEGGCSDK